MFHALCFAAAAAPAVAQPLTLCPCNATQGYRQIWYEIAVPGVTNASTVHWGFPKGASCIDPADPGTCSLCNSKAARALGWTSGAGDGRVEAVDTGLCLTATPSNTTGRVGGVVTAPCDDVTNSSTQRWSFAGHRITLLGHQTPPVCVTGGSPSCAALPPPAPPPPHPPHSWPGWKRRRWVNAIITRSDWPRYLDVLRQHPGSISAVSECKDLDTRSLGTHISNPHTVAMHIRRASFHTRAGPWPLNQDHMTS